MTFFIDKARFMLDETFFRTLARHAHIQTFQYPIILWVGLSKSAMFGKNFFGQLNNVDVVLGFGHEILDS